MKPVIISEIDHVAHIKLHRPDVRNSFNAEMIHELTNIFEKLELRDDLRAITLSGEGKVFCAGADLNWMKSMVEFSYAENLKDAQALYQMFSAQKKLNLPLIALVHGAAYGGALGLIANCDYVIAEEGTSFCFSEVKLGISPAVISSFVLDKASPLVKHYMLSGSVFNAQKAKELFLVDEILGKEHTHHQLQSIIHHYKECGPLAVQKTKQLLKAIAEEESPTKELTTQLIAELRTSLEGQEGLKSFLEKRKPSWRS